MRNFRLSPEELSLLREAHRSERNKRSAYKLNAVILLGSGWKIKATKEALLIDDETLRSYVDKYKTQGIDGLLETNYKGSSSHLSAEQKEALLKELDSTIHLTTHSVIEHVSNAFSVTYSSSGMRDLLHRLGYVFKKPTLVPGKPDREAQEEFVLYYDAFMEAKSANEEVLFIDAVHPEHNTMAAYGWLKKGERRCLKTNSGRQRLNLHGAVNIETMEITVIESETVDADSTIDLLETLNQKYPLSERLHIILDNARYHYSVKVREYLAGNSRINLVFLPPYSPELNLIERVWKYFKQNVLYNKYHENLSDFRQASIDFFKNIKNHKDKLSALLGGGFEGFSYT